MNHDLKTDPEVFAGIWDGSKTHTIRLDDRGFKVGDMLTLLETKHSGDAMRQGAPLVYTGRKTYREVSHIQTGYGLGEGWCILSFKLPYPVALVGRPEITGLDSSDRERLLYVARVLRSAANLQCGIPLGGLWSDIVMSFGTIKRVVGLTDEDTYQLNDPQLQAMPDDIARKFVKTFRNTILDSPRLREAAIAWFAAGGKTAGSPEWDGVIDAIATSLERCDLHPLVFAQEQAEIKAKKKAKKTA